MCFNGVLTPAHDACNAEQWCRISHVRLWRNLQAWTALGRLYAEGGAGAGDGLAANCYMQARSHDPMYAAPWEAMAAMSGTRLSGPCHFSHCNMTFLLPGACAELLSIACRRGLLI